MFNRYKTMKEMADLINEVRELRTYYGVFSEVHLWLSKNWFVVIAKAN